MKLSIVVPAYNEEARIGKMLAAYLPYFAERYGAEFEVIVSVNGSRDGTADVVRALQPAHPQLRVIVDPRPIGKGGGVDAAGADIQGVGPAVDGDFVVVDACPRIIRFE